MPHDFHAAVSSHKKKNFLQAFIDPRFFIGDRADAQISQLPFIQFSDFRHRNIVMRFDALLQAE